MSDNSAVVASQNGIDQRENARREQARSRIAKLSGYHKQRAQTTEDEKIQAFEEENSVSMHVARSGKRLLCVWNHNSETKIIYRGLQEVSRLTENNLAVTLPKTNFEFIFVRHQIYC